jgi:stringent starvation protein B
MASNINDLKKQVFYEMLNLTGSVFVHVSYSEDVVIGNRGFLGEEKEKGIILVLNSRMNFEWNESGITATLVFGTTSEKCFIPADDILSIFSPELGAQFSLYPQKKEESVAKPDSATPAKLYKGKKVIKVDFNKKK